MGYDRTLPFKEAANEMFKEAIVCLEKGERDDPLSYDERKEVTVLLSWGGPSDGFIIHFDKDGDAIQGHYFFADWFEYEQFKLSDEQLDRVLDLYFP